MKIVRLTFAPYELPLLRPLVTSQGSITSRRGFIVALFADDGRVGLGEAAPLPSVSIETLFNVRRELVRLQESCPTCLSERSSELPSVTFALESAAMSLREPGMADEKAITVNALISEGDHRRVLENVQQAVEAGYETVKLKVGVRARVEEVELLQEIRCRWPEIRLRVDANGAWTSDHARQFCSSVSDLKLEYVEDPLRENDAAVLRELREQVPIALDESIMTAEQARTALEQKLCDVLVIKPSRMGSMNSMPRIAAEAQRHAVDIVITSLLESSLGLRFVAHWAARWGSSNRAHGLSTAELFAMDTLNVPLLPVRGKLRVRARDEQQQRLKPEIASTLGLV